MVGYLNAPSRSTRMGGSTPRTSSRSTAIGSGSSAATRDLINVAGQKVYPAEVEQAILELDNIDDVAVYGEAESAAWARSSSRRSSTHRARETQLDLKLRIRTRLRAEAGGIQAPDQGHRRRPRGLCTRPPQEEAARVKLTERDSAGRGHGARPADLFAIGAPDHGRRGPPAGRRARWPDRSKYHGMTTGPIAASPSTWRAQGQFALDGISETMIIGQILFSAALPVAVGLQPSAFAVGGRHLRRRRCLERIRAGSTSILPTREAALAAASLVLFPGYLAYATSYMSDVPALAAQFLCLAAGVRAMRGHGTDKSLAAQPPRRVGIVAFSIREFGAAALASVFLVALLRDVHDRRNSCSRWPRSLRASPS